MSCSLFWSQSQVHEIQTCMRHSAKKHWRRVAMKIFLAGATGAIGTRLLPLLVRAGHAVTGTTQHSDKARSIHAAGATPVVLNALDAQQVLEAVGRAEPD